MILEIAKWISLIWTCYQTMGITIYLWLNRERELSTFDLAPISFWAFYWIYFLITAIKEEEEQP